MSTPQNVGYLMIWELMACLSVSIPAQQEPAMESTDRITELTVAKPVRATSTEPISER